MTASASAPAVDVGIVTADAAALVGFYRDVLGLPLQAEITAPALGTITRLAWGQSVVKIVQPTIPPAPPPRPDRFAATAGVHYLTLVVADLQDSLARCRAAGALVLVEVTAVRPGVTAAIVTDPDGNPVELMQRD